jgi:hypothetical protein
VNIILFFYNNLKSLMDPLEHAGDDPLVVIVSIQGNDEGYKVDLTKVDSGR